MLIRIYRGACRWFSCPRGLASSSRAGVAPAFLFVPLFGEAPMVVDSWLFTLVAALGVLAGVSIGVVYRHLHGQIEETKARAANAEAELRTLLTITDDAIVVLDKQGVIRAVNPAAEELFVRSADELCGGEVTEVIPQRFVLADVTRHGPASFEAYATRLGEENLAVEVVLSPVDLAQGRSYLLLTRPKVEPPREIRDLSEPVAKFCHDLNNQLTGVLGNLSMVLMNGPVDGTTRERVTNAKRAMLKAQDLTRKMQAVARNEEMEVKTAPVTATIVQMPPLPVPAAPTPSKATRVMVLDDEPAICDLVSIALEAMGYEVTSKGDGASAVSTCEEAVRSGRPFSLVISDLSLPGELDGAKAVARMRGLDADLKAIISSGYDHDPIMLHHREHGFAAAITKPFEMSQLMRVVREVLCGDSTSRKTA